MTETGVAAILALLLAAVPLVALGLAIAAVVVGAVLVFGFLALLEQPFRVWFLTLSLLLDVLVLIPLGFASWGAMVYSPGLWQQARGAVLTFTGVLLAPTVLLALYSARYYARQKR